MNLNLNGFNNFILKTTWMPEPGLNCLTGAIFARQRFTVAQNPPVRKYQGVWGWEDHTVLSDRRSSQFENKLLHIKVQRFRGGLVCKTHRLYLSLNFRLETNKEKKKAERTLQFCPCPGSCPETLNPKPKPRNPKPETRKSKIETQNPKPENQNPKLSRHLHSRWQLTEGKLTGGSWRQKNDSWLELSWQGTRVAKSS